ncbi:MAG: hypothetical protein AABX30_00730 [Nanoarchaeota archaeon]
MAGEELVYALPEALQNTINVVLYILGTVGIFIIIYIVFGIISAFLNRKAKNELKKINENLEEIKQLLRNRRV